MSRKSEKTCLFYDGGCPFCLAETGWLRQRSGGDGLELEDIQSESFDPKKYGLTRGDVEGGLHARLPDGRIVSRMDAVRAAYSAVGLGWMLAPTRWRILRPLFDVAYSIFARNRIRWGKALLRFHHPRSTGSKHPKQSE
ncbi:MAG: DUF393 domain-containing protein [Kiritimatiellia bacterium]|nr:DUF393 domain-containing protein [Kiritimatiellia bacterium]